MVTYAIVNQKGGVGKTTATTNLAAGLALADRRVLVIDLDPQGDLTIHLGLSEAAEQRPSAYDLVLGEAPLDACLLERPLDGTGRALHAISGQIGLSGLGLKIHDRPNRHQLLEQALAGTRDRFDICLIDCPPTLGLLAVQGMVAADYLLVPIVPEYLALKKLQSLLETLQRLRKQTKPDLQFAGVFVSHYDRRRGIHVEGLRAIQEWVGDYCFKTVIRTDTKISEAPSGGRTIFEHAPETHGAEDYRRLVSELIDRYEQGTKNVEQPVR